MRKNYNRDAAEAKPLPARDYCPSVCNTGCIARKDTVSENEVKYDKHILHHARLDSKPSGHNCWCLYPLPEGVGECFAEHIVAPVDIGMNAPTIRCPI